ncbi:MAG: hypothetical protein KDD70_16445 [Bdellovibrionales bacterium]|nr:hypothetical protein [Bdellovibrionales bacterium]
MRDVGMHTIRFEEKGAANRVTKFGLSALFLSVSLLLASVSLAAPLTTYVYTGVEIGGNDLFEVAVPADPISAPVSNLTYYWGFFDINLNKCPGGSCDRSVSCSLKDFGIIQIGPLYSYVAGCDNPLVVLVDSALYFDAKGNNPFARRMECEVNGVLMHRYYTVSATNPGVFDPINDSLILEAPAAVEPFGNQLVPVTQTSPFPPFGPITVNYPMPNPLPPQCL